MTRLISNDICDVDKRMSEYDKQFIEQTGKSLVEIAKMAAGVPNCVNCLNTAVVTVTCGEGIISGFAHTEEAILKYAGIDTYVTKKNDIAGLQEAYLKKKNIVFMADDDAYVALGIGKPVCSDNGEATGFGYATALISAMKHRNISTIGQKVLVLGAGPVGRAAAKMLTQAGITPCIYDIDKEKKALIEKEVKKAVILHEKPEYKAYTYIVDATTQGDFIGDSDVTADTIIAAPGMPWGATKEAMEIATVIHNPLELGTLTMYYQCVADWK